MIFDVRFDTNQFRSITFTSGLRLLSVVLFKHIQISFLTATQAVTDRTTRRNRWPNTKVMQKVTWNFVSS